MIIATTISINSTTVGEFFVFVIGLGTVITMIIKVSNYQNDLKREMEKKTDQLKNRVEKLNFKINTLAITAKSKQDLNAARINNIEKFLEKNHGYAIREDLPTANSGADFLESLDNLDRD